jgi:hypothetical protein
MLAHKGVHEGHVAAEVISGKKHFFDPKTIPSIAYTEPEMAWVGITEKEAKEQGLNFEKSVFPWAASGRAIASDCSEGMTKLIFDKDTHRILGGAVVGTNAGELLGEDQSGQIESIGFSLYMQLLERAIKAIQDGKMPNMDTPLESISQEVNLHTSTLIPADYLPDVHGRLILYKRIANAENREQLDDLRSEIIDRFGGLPQSLRDLFAVTELKLKLEPLGIVRLDLGQRSGRLEFSSQPQVDPLAVVRLVQNEPNTYKLDGATLLRVKRTLQDFESRLAFANELLDKLDGRDHQDLVANA